MYYGKRFSFQKGKYELTIQLADAEIYGPPPRFEVHALDFRVSILSHKAADNDEHAYDKEPVVIENNHEYVKSSLGVYRIGIENNGFFLWIECCEG